MSGSIFNNGSASGNYGASALGLTVSTLAFWGKVGAAAYTTGSGYQYIGTYSAWAFQLEIYINRSSGELRFYSSSVGEITIATGSSTAWRYFALVVNGTTVTVEVSAVGSSSWTTVASFSVTAASSDVAFFDSATASYLRSARLFNVAMSQANRLLEKDSRTIVDTAHCIGAWADGATPVAATWGTDLSGAGHNLSVSGTAVYDSDDPIPDSGTTVNLTGLSAGIALTAGAAAVVAAYSTLGRSAGIALTAGAFTPSAGVLPGNAANIAAQFGTLGPSGAEPVTGRAVGISVQAGALGQGTALSGQAVGITVQAGTPAPAGQYPVAGSAVGITAAAGTMTAPGGGNPSGQYVGVSAQAGSLGAQGAASLGGQAAGIAVSHGTVGNQAAQSTAGQAAGLALGHGSLGVTGTYATLGQFAGLALSAGAVATPDSLLGRAIGISAQAGGLGLGVDVAGRFVNISVQAGALGQGTALSGQAVGITVQAGSLSAPQGSDPTGQVLGIAVQAGAVGAQGATSTLGASLGISVAHGTFAAGQGVAGRQLGIATQAGTIGTVGGLSVLGRFVGISAQAGTVSSPGEELTRYPLGVSVGVSAQAGALTYVDLGPPVDWLLRHEEIRDNEEQGLWAMADLWRGKPAAEDLLPATFPYLRKLNAVGYWMPRQVKAAFGAELVAAGFSEKQALVILAAAEKL